MFEKSKGIEHKTNCDFLKYNDLLIHKHWVSLHLLSAISKLVSIQCGTLYCKENIKHRWVFELYESNLNFIWTLLFYNDWQIISKTYINISRWNGCKHKGVIDVGGSWSAQWKPTCQSSQHKYAILQFKLILVHVQVKRYKSNMKCITGC